MELEVVTLPADGRAARLARTAVRDRLHRWQLDDLLDVAELLTSEVVANVIVHTTSAPTLRLDRDGAGVRVTVADGSPVPPRLREHAVTATTGRGMQLLHDLADDWGWERLDGGKAVWFRLHARTGDGPAAPMSGEARAAPAAVSPLGRYAAAAGAGDTVRVQLLGVPVRLLAASREHHDGLLRECRLLAMSGPRPGMPPALAELVDELGVRFGAARSRPDEDFDRAVRTGLETVDLTYTVPASVVDGARRLEDLMRRADELCRSRQLITLPRTAAMEQFAHWYVSQFTDQVAGRPATPWTGPLDPA